MKMRIRNKWSNRNRKSSLEDNATALAYVIWQIALTAAKSLHAKDFDYRSDEQRFGVIAEYLIFLVHVTDRLAFGQMGDEPRQHFVKTVAQQTARHYQRNLEDLQGGGDYASELIDKLNCRSADYAETRFEGTEPGYATRRIIGERIQELMGTSQTNKWVIQQVMDADAIEAARQLKTSMVSLFGSSDLDLRPDSKDAVIGAD